MGTAILCPEALQSDVVTDLRELWKAIGEPDDAQETKLQDVHTADCEAQLSGIDWQCQTEPKT